MPNHDPALEPLRQKLDELTAHINTAWMPRSRPGPQGQSQGDSTPQSNTILQWITRIWRGGW